MKATREEVIGYCFLLQSAHRSGLVKNANDLVVCLIFHILGIDATKV